jgi:hypothetical protein
MTVYDIPNIEHCDVSMVGTVLYRIVAHPGWYIYQADNIPGVDPETGNPTKVYRGMAVLRTDYDFSLVEITAEADLPDNAQICGDTTPDHEVM